MSLKEVVHTLFSHSAPIIVIFGRLDSGKTDLALLLAQKMLEYDMVKKVATNIKIEDDSIFRDKFERVTSVEKLKIWLEEDKRTHKLFILDECGENIDARNPMGRINKEIRYVGFKVRKYRQKMILIIQRIKDLESTFRSDELTLAKIKKLGKTRAIIISDLFVGRWNTDTVFLNDIPKTKINFDTYDVAPFELDEEITGGLNEPCCLVAKLYMGNSNLTIIGRQMKLAPQEVKRLLQRHLRHTFKA